MRSTPNTLSNSVSFGPPWASSATKTRSFRPFPILKVSLMWSSMFFSSAATANPPPAKALLEPTSIVDLLTTVVLTPFLADSIAALRPAKPLPMTKTSVSKDCVRNLLQELILFILFSQPRLRTHLGKSLNRNCEGDCQSLFFENRVCRCHFLLGGI